TGKTTTLTGAGGKSTSDGFTLVPDDPPITKTAAATKRTMVESKAPNLSQSRPNAKPRQVAPPAAKGKLVFFLIGGVGVGIVSLLSLCLIGLWAAGVFRLTGADSSTLVVEINEPNAAVYIDGEKVNAIWSNAGKQGEIRVKPGTRRVEI